MGEFMANYGIWIIFGLLFLFMMWGHTRGHGVTGCGMGNHGHNTSHNSDIKKEEAQQKANKSSSGCH